MHAEDLPLPEVRVPPAAGTRRREYPSQAGRRRRCRPGRHGRGDRPAPARRAGAAARRRRHGVDRIARRVLRQAHAGDPRPARRRRCGVRQGRELGRRPHVLPRQRGLPLQPAPAARPQAAGHDQPAAVLPRGDAGRALRGPRRRDALEEQGRRGASRASTVRCSRSKRRTAATRSIATGWSSPTARAARSVTCSASTSKARSSPTAS